MMPAQPTDHPPPGSSTAVLPSTAAAAMPPPTTAIRAHGASLPRLAMPLPQRAVPLDSDSDDSLSPTRSRLSVELPLPLSQDCWSLAQASEATASSHLHPLAPPVEPGQVGMELDNSPSVEAPSDSNTLVSTDSSHIAATFRVQPWVKSFLPTSSPSLSSAEASSVLALDPPVDLARVQSPIDGVQAYSSYWTKKNSQSASSPLRSAFSLFSHSSPTTSSLPTDLPEGQTPLFSYASFQIATRVAILFILSTTLVVCALMTLPIPLPAKGITHLTITEIRAMSVALRTYAHGALPAAFHTWGVLISFFLWKQAWSVPGSIVMNVFLGMLYGTYLATLYTSIFTATGGVLCYLLSRPVKPIIEHLPGFQKPLQAMRRSLKIPAGKRRSSGKPRKKPTGLLQFGSGWTYLLLLRLVPVVPWSAMNICCAVLGVPLWSFWASFALGSVPWNFVTTQVGEILQDLLSALPTDPLPPSPEDGVSSTGLSVITAKIWSPEMLVKLLLLTIASLVPMLLQWYVKRSRATSSLSSSRTSGQTLVSDDEDALLSSEEADEENENEDPPYPDHDLLTHSEQGEAYALRPTSFHSGAQRTPSPLAQLLGWGSSEADVESSPATESANELLTPPVSRLGRFSLGRSRASLDSVPYPVWENDKFDTRMSLDSVRPSSTTVWEKDVSVQSFPNSDLDPIRPWNTSTPRGRKPILPPLFLTEAKAHDLHPARTPSPMKALALSQHWANKKLSTITKTEPPSSLPPTFLQRSFV